MTLDIAAGSVVALTGASGSGKSTLLHMIGAIEQADRGTVTVDDVEVTGLRRRPPSPATGSGSGSSSSATTCCPR